MDVTGIGVQTITPTTGTVLQNSQSPDRPADRDSEQRVTPPPPPQPGTGAIVDKSV